MFSDTVEFGHTQQSARLYRLGRRESTKEILEQHGGVVADAVDCSSSHRLVASRLAFAPLHSSSDIDIEFLTENGDLPLIKPSTDFLLRTVSHVSVLNQLQKLRSRHTVGTSEAESIRCGARI